MCGASNSRYWIITFNSTCGKARRNVQSIRYLRVDTRQNYFDEPVVGDTPTDRPSANKPKIGNRAANMAGVLSRMGKEDDSQWDEYIYKKVGECQESKLADNQYLLRIWGPLGADSAGNIDRKEWEAWIDAEITKSAQMHSIN
ncbi:hypothetical protein C8R44DRAFT_747678 [Mycena epipterygia]|nr:hypothetical protein C8R44DRAFT_747678 [Mycena epipterygia]